MGTVLVGMGWGRGQWCRNELRVGGIGLAQKREALIRRKTPENFFVVPLHFLALQLVIMVSAFVMVSTVWSVYVCCSSTHYAPRAQPFVKVGARAIPRALWSRRHWTGTMVVGMEIKWWGLGGDGYKIFHHVILYQTCHWTFLMIN